MSECQPSSKTNKLVKTLKGIESPQEKNVLSRWDIANQRSKIIMKLEYLSTNLFTRIQVRSEMSSELNRCVPKSSDLKLWSFGFRIPGFKSFIAECEFAGWRSTGLVFPICVQFQIEMNSCKSVYMGKSVSLRLRIVSHQKMISHWVNNSYLEIERSYKIALLLIQLLTYHKQLNKSSYSVPSRA